MSCFGRNAAPLLHHKKDRVNATGGEATDCRGLGGLLVCFQSVGRNRHSVLHDPRLHFRCRGRAGCALHAVRGSGRGSRHRRQRSGHPSFLYSAPSGSIPATWFAGTFSRSTPQKMNGYGVWIQSITPSTTSPYAWNRSQGGGPRQQHDWSDPLVLWEESVIST